MPEQNTEPERANYSAPVAGRIIAYLFASVIGVAIFQFIGIIISGVPLEQLGNLVGVNGKATLILTVWGLIPVLFFTYVFRRNVDKASFASLGISIKGRGRDILAGLIVAVLVFGIGLFFMIKTGNIALSVCKISSGNLLIYFVTFIFVAISEELMVRGYVLNNLLAVANKYVALFISALIFALLHSLNAGLTWLAMVNLFLAGMLLGSAYIFTKNLWFAVSLHLFWNFIQGPLLGFKVSGNITESYFCALPSGKQYLSGGDFGFEGSVVCSVLCLVFTAAIVFYYEQKARRTSQITN